MRMNDSTMPSTKGPQGHLEAEPLRTTGKQLTWGGFPRYHGTGVPVGGPAGPRIQYSTARGARPCRYRPSFSFPLQMPLEFSIDADRFRSSADVELPSNIGAASVWSCFLAFISSHLGHACAPTIMGSCSSSRRPRYLIASRMISFITERACGDGARTAAVMAQASPTSMKGRRGGSGW